MIFSKLRNENMTKIMRAMKMVMPGRSDVTGITTNECDVCIPDNITIIPLYRINDSLSDQVSRCNYCGREWNEFWISYSYVTLSLITQKQLK